MSPFLPYRGLRFRSCLLLLVAALALLPATLSAQQDDGKPAPPITTPPPPPPPGMPTPDTTKRGDAGGVPEDYVISKSPTTAVLLSILPGGGQLYNEQYWKIPLFAIPAGYFAVQAVRNHQRFADYRDQGEAILARIAAGDTASDDLEGTYESIKRQREFYRDNRDLNIAYFLVVEGLSMIDAYVGAHMFDFTVGDTAMRLELLPGPGVGIVGRW